MLQGRLTLTVKVKIDPLIGCAHLQPVCKFLWRNVGTQQVNLVHLQHLARGNRSGVDKEDRGDPQALQDRPCQVILLPQPIIKRNDDSSLWQRIVTPDGSPYLLATDEVASACQYPELRF